MDGQGSRRSSTDMRHQLQTQCKNTTGCLPWDNDSAIMVNFNKSNAICETPFVGDARELTDVNQFSSHTFPRTSHSALNSPRKYRLSPEYEHRNRSPSASPKLKKRVMAPPKPAQIDNSSLVMPNQYKVCAFVSNTYTLFCKLSCVNLASEQKTCSVLKKS